MATPRARFAQVAVQRIQRGFGVSQLGHRLVDLLERRHQAGSGEGIERDHRQRLADVVIHRQLVEHDD